MILFCLLATGPKVYAQTQNTAEATVAVGLRVVVQRNLRFGVISVGNSAGSVTISPSGERTSTGAGIVLLGTDYWEAIFELQGEPWAQYDIALPSNVDITRVGGTETMRVGSWRSYPWDNWLAEFRTLNSSGAATVNVGATLHVGPNQTPGLYIGNFEVTFSYN